MRTLFSSTPAFGHVLPMVPLAQACVEHGDEASFLTCGAFAPHVHPAALLDVGPTFAGLAERFYASTGADPVSALDPWAFAEMFARARIETTFEEALDSARHFGAGLVVCEREDVVGPMVAATLRLPWARFLLGADLPQEVTDAIGKRARSFHDELGLTVEDPVATIDPWPVPLQPEAWRPAPRRLAIQPAAFGTDLRRQRRAGTTRSGRSRTRVLVSPGTIADDAVVVDRLIGALLRLDVDLVLTGRHGQPWPITHGDRVEQVGFAPLARLLADVDAAVIAGGSGTLVGALAAGVPVVIAPMVFDQQLNGRLAEATGAAILVNSVDAAGRAVSTVLTDASYRQAAEHMAAYIATMPAPADAWNRLRTEAGRRSGRRYDSQGR